MHLSAGLWLLLSLCALCSAEGSWSVVTHSQLNMEDIAFPSVVAVGDLLCGAGDFKGHLFLESDSEGVYSINSSGKISRTGVLACWSRADGTLSFAKSLPQFKEINVLRNISTDQLILLGKSANDATVIQIYDLEGNKYTTSDVDTAKLLIATIEDAAVVNHDPHQLLCATGSSRYDCPPTTQGVYVGCWDVSVDTSSKAATFTEMPDLSIQACGGSAKANALSVYESTLFWAGTYEVNITLVQDNGAQHCKAAVETNGGAFVARIQFAPADEVTISCLETDGDKVPEMLDIGAESTTYVWAVWKSYNAQNQEEILISQVMFGGKLPSQKKTGLCAALSSPRGCAEPSSIEVVGNLTTIVARSNIALKLNGESLPALQDGDRVLVVTLNTSQWHATKASVTVSIVRVDVIQHLVTSTVAWKAPLAVVSHATANCTGVAALFSDTYETSDPFNMATLMVQYACRANPPITPPPPPPTTVTTTATSVSSTTVAATTSATSAAAATTSASSTAAASSTTAAATSTTAAAASTTAAATSTATTSASSTTSVTATTTTSATTTSAATTTTTTGTTTKTIKPKPTTTVATTTAAAVTGTTTTTAATTAAPEPTERPVSTKSIVLFVIFLVIIIAIIAGGIWWWRTAEVPGGVHSPLPR